MSERTIYPREILATLLVMTFDWEQKIDKSDLPEKNKEILRKPILDVRESVQGWAAKQKMRLVQ